MRLTDEQYNALADNLVENLYHEGEIESYIIFLWEELVRLNPAWITDLFTDYLDLEARLSEEEE